LTSRLSGPLFEMGGVYYQSENTLAATSRFFRRENRTRGISPPRRTQNVHTKISGASFEAPFCAEFSPRKSVYADPVSALSKGLNWLIERAVGTQHRSWA
jgi:hypothetical protein